MLYLVSLLPPLLLILLLFWLDSFSLVRKGNLALCFFWGALSTVGAILVYRTILPGGYALWWPPVAEETLKGLVVLWLVRTRRAVFFIDAALYGVAAGAGFAVAENITYLLAYPDMLLGTALLRGMGTAIMHCGAVASTSVILSWLMQRKGHAVRFYPLALLPAMALHTFYNALLLPPVLTLPVICLGVVIVLGALLLANEKSIGKWMEQELASEVGMLSAMRKGEFGGSNAGRYMLSARQHFPPDVFMDLHCCLRIYLELSILAKRNMMLAEAGLTLPAEEQKAQQERTAAMVREFTTLRKGIGKSGRLVLSPLIRPDRLEWIVRSAQ